MDENETEEEAAPVEPSPSVMKWVLPGGVALFLAILGAQLAAPLLTTMIYGDPNAPPEEIVDDEEGAEEVAAPSPEPPDFSDLDPAIYTPLDPPLLASFTTDDGSTRFLQLSVQAMARDQRSIDAIQQHAPALRNGFLFLISNRSYADIATVEGKEKLRAEMLQEAQAILRRNTGEPGVEELYFTSLVVQ